jgi:diacylglycerol kinase (ATP)
VGGDGTVNEVANGLLEAESTELAVIPRGTGVDFPRTYGIPRRLEDAVAVARGGGVREIDVGRVGYRTWGGAAAASHFVNIASAGMSGAIAKRTNESTKALGGKLSYLWATFAVFARWQHAEMRVSVGDEIRGGRMLDVMVANGRFLAGGMMITPDAEPDDGIFDVLLIGDLTKAELVRVTPKLYRGTHLPHPKAELLRGSSVSVDADVALPIELDGEQPGTTPARFEVLPRALRLRVP